MDKAVKSTAVVSSLFPEAVHDRLFADKSEEIEQSKEMVWKNDEPEQRASIKAFLHYKMKRHRPEVRSVSPICVMLIWFGSIGASD
jgi:hypothetical protein